MSTIHTNYRPCAWDNCNRAAAFKKRGKFVKLPACKNHERIFKESHGGYKGYSFDVAVIDHLLLDETISLEHRHRLLIQKRNAIRNEIAGRNDHTSLIKIVYKCRNHAIYVNSLEHDLKTTCHSIKKVNVQILNARRQRRVAPLWPEAPLPTDTSALPTLTAGWMMTDWSTALQFLPPPPSPWFPPQPPPIPPPPPYPRPTTIDSASTDAPITTPR